MVPSATAEAPALHIRFDEKVPILLLPEEMDFEPLRSWLKDVVPAHIDTIGGRTARLDIGSRAVNLLELRRVLHLLRESWNIEVTGLYCTADVVHRFAERELRLKLFVHDPGELAPATEDLATELLVDDPGDEPGAPSKLDALSLPNDIEPADLVEDGGPALANPTHTDGSRRTLVIHRTLRSGTVVRFDGDVTVFGDVNPGAQVVATGNLVVLGALKGMAWAGAAGDDRALILAHLLRPTQLRIARKIAIVPEVHSDDGFNPELASIVDDQISIQPFPGRSRGK